MTREDTKLPTSFVGKTGKFYIRQHRADGSGLHHRVTVWPSVEDYDKRTSAILAFCNADEAMGDFSHELKINPQTLTTTWPADPDPTDFGLTPERNIWRNRFQQVQEGRNHAA